MVGIAAERISQIYLGKDSACRCGCRGEYVEPGHPKFLKRLKRFHSLVCTPGSQTQDGGSYINVSYGNDRAMTVYLNDQAISYQPEKEFKFPVDV